MNNPLGVSPRKGNQGTTRGKEKKVIKLILCFTICVHSATRHNIHMYLLYLVRRVWRDKNKGERKIPPAFARPFSVARPVFASHSLVTLVLDGLSEMAIVFMPKLAGLLKMLPSFWSLIKQRMRLYTFSLPVPSESWEGMCDTTVSKLTREKIPDNHYLGGSVMRKRVKGWLAWNCTQTFLEHRFILSSVRKAL